MSSTEISAGVAAQASSRSFSQGHAYNPAKDGAPKLYTDVLYDYEAQRDEELTVRAGDEVGVLKAESLTGWYLCSLHGRAGLVPSNFLERFQQHSIRLTEFEPITKPARAVPLQTDTWSSKLQAVEEEVAKMQETITATRLEAEKSWGDRAIPLAANDIERVVYDLIKLGMLLEEDSDEVSDFGQRLRTAWEEFKTVRRDVENDLNAVPQLGHFRQKINKNLKQLAKSLREEETFRNDLAIATEDCINSLVSLRVHMEQRRREKDEDSSSSKGGSAVNGKASS